MRLTTLCFFKQLYKGSMFHGKKRHVKKVTFKAMEELRAEYARQEKIMTLLKHPYLSLEESRGHALALKKPEQYIANKIEMTRLSKLQPHIRIEDRLHHLTVKDAWD